MDIKALIETGKSFLRGLYFAIVGVVGTSLASLATDESLVDNVVSINGVYLPVGVGIAAGIGFVAKLIDRYVHKNQNLSLNGITPTDLLER